MARKPTLSQVATEAGVSIGTASNAFNRPEALSAELLERVRSAADRLGYAGPDPSARRLRTGRAGAIGLVFTADLPFAFNDAASVEFLLGLAHPVEETGAGLLIIPGFPATEDPARVVREAAVDGFILYSTPIGDPRAEAALARSLPTVAVDQPREIAATWVGIDDRGAAADAARHLRQLGHKRVAVIAFATTVFDKGELMYELTLERLAGYAEGLGDAHDPELVVTAMPNSTEQGRVVATELLQSPDPPTAILAMSDAIGAGALQAAQNLGRAVPEDVSIVGFDDSPLARQTTPTLTSVAQNQRRKGEEAARLLLGGIEGEEQLDPGKRILLPHELVVRGSTAPPG